MLDMDTRIQFRDMIFNQLFENHIITERDDCNGGYLNVLNKSKFNNILSNNLQLKILYNTYIQEFRTEEEARYCLLHKDDFTNHICPVCKVNICKFYNRFSGYRTSCGSKECMKKLLSTEESKQKRSESCLKNLGVDNPFKVEGFIEMRNQENLKRYGDTCPLRLEKFKQKRINTVRQRHGKDYITQTDEFKRQRKESLKRNHNDENYNNQEKIKESMRNRYGIDNAMKIDRFKKKREKTNRNKYNVNYVSQSKEYRLTNRKRYNVFHYSQRHIQNYDIWINDNTFESYIIKQYNIKGSFLILKEIMDWFNVSRALAARRVRELNLLDYVYIQDSNLELDFKYFLDNYNIKYRRHYIISDIETHKKREIDFICQNIGFEINDISTHNCSDNNHHKGINYHKDKTDLAKKRNIRLIHIWEWELRNDLEWIKIFSWITNSLLNQSKVQLDLETDCQYDIRLVNKEDQIAFLDQYSFDNNREFIKCIGIYYDNKLIQTISFVNERIISICVKFGYELVNGTEKLIQSYIQNSKVSYVLTYVDLSKFTGETLENMGFKLLNYIQPQITWCNKEMNHFDNIDSKETHKGYVPIYDCGVNVYKLEREENQY